jgi:hypothetical protein
MDALALRTSDPNMRLVMSHAIFAMAQESTLMVSLVND